MTTINALSLSYTYFITKNTGRYSQISNSTCVIYCGTGRSINTSSRTGCTHNTSSGTGRTLNTNWDRKHQFWDRMYLTLILDRIDLTLILGRDVTYTNSGTGCTHNTNSGTGCALNTNWIECTLHQFWDRMYLTLILG